MLVFGHLMREDARFLSNRLDEAIKLTDGVVDHEYPPEIALDVFSCMVTILNTFSNTMYFTPRVNEELGKLIQAEYLDLDFTPGKLDIENDILIWEGKAGRLSVEFAIACACMPSVDTEENWGCIREWQKAGLILNDCSDITTGRYEDLKMKRRNYVLLTEFSPDIYVEFRSKEAEIIAKAHEVANRVRFEKPKDESLMKAWEVVNELLRKL